MNSHLFAWIMALLFIMVLVGLTLNKLLFNRLARSHAQKYEAMGKPSLILRNNIFTGWATIKFVFCREHRNLGDSYLSKLSDLIFLHAMIYLISLISFSLLLFSQ